MSQDAVAPAITFESDGFSQSWRAGEPSEPLRLKYMAPGHFCPDVVDLLDFGEADSLRGRVVRGFMWLMEFWPKPGSTPHD